MDASNSRVCLLPIRGVLLMIAIRFEYKDKLRAGTLLSNRVSKKGNAFFQVYHDNGRCKSYRWDRAARVELFNLSGLSVQVSRI